MSHPVLKVSAEVILALATAITIGKCTGCKDPVSPDGVQAAYTAELLACVQTAETREEADLCRQQVNAKYGVCGIGPDGGLAPCPR